MVYIIYIFIKQTYRCIVKPRSPYLRVRSKSTRITRSTGESPANILSANVCAMRCSIVKCLCARSRIRERYLVTVPFAIHITRRAASSTRCRLALDPRPVYKIPHIGIATSPGTYITQSNTQYKLSTTHTHTPPFRLNSGRAN